MDHKNYKNYSLPELYNALDSVDDVDYPGQRQQIENIGEEEQLCGLRGWLILVAVALLVAPFRQGILFVETYPQIFFDGYWEIITTPGNEAYHPFWAPFILSEIIVSSALILVSLYLLYLFFTAKKHFPTWYIGVSLFSLSFILADAWWLTLILPEEPMLDSGTTMEITLALLSCSIWIPYMLVSKRVKATFVN
jgi:hypothetical protein